MRRLSRVFLAAVLFCGFAADFLYSTKVGSLSFVLVVGDIWAAGYLLFAAVSLAGLVGCFVDGKDKQSSIGRFFGGAFCGGLFVRRWLTDEVVLDLVSAFMFCGGVDHARLLGIPIRWVWDPGIASALGGGGSSDNEDHLLASLRSRGRGGFVAAGYFVSDLTQGRGRWDGLGPFGLSAMLLIRTVLMQGHGFDFKSSLSVFWCYCGLMVFFTF